MPGDEDGEDGDGDAGGQGKARGGAGGKKKPSEKEDGFEDHEEDEGLREGKLRCARAVCVLQYCSTAVRYMRGRCRSSTPCGPWREERSGARRERAARAAFQRHASSLLLAYRLPPPGPDPPP